MDRPLQLVLIRHPESERNAAKKGNIYFPDEISRELVRGIPDQDIGITPLGVNQATVTGIQLAARFPAPDYAYHSGYKRTKEGLEYVLNAFPSDVRANIQVRSKTFIRERHPGYTYDMTTAEAEVAFPWLKEYWQTFGGFHAVPPGGESIATMVQRVYLFLNMLFRDRAGKRVWVMTHGGTLRCFRYLLERWTDDQAIRWPEGMAPKNCGVTIYEFPPEQEPQLIQYNTVYY